MASIKGKALTSRYSGVSVTSGPIWRFTMTTLSDFANDPRHAAVAAIGKMMGIPDSIVEKVVCADCGKTTMAANCYWNLNRTTFRHTGPHCGCKSTEPTNKDVKHEY